MSGSLSDAWKRSQGLEVTGSLILERAVPQVSRKSSLCPEPGARAQGSAASRRRRLCQACPSRDVSVYEQSHLVGALFDFFFNPPSGIITCVLHLLLSPSSLTSLSVAALYSCRGFASRGLCPLNVLTRVKCSE